MNAFIVVPTPPKGVPVTPDMLCAALLQDMGCRIGGYDIEEIGNKAYSNQVEWFNPFKVTSMAEYLALPEHWQAIFRNQNRECWRCGYRYMHIPKDILCQYPHIPVKGLFAVMGDSTTMDTVVGSDLIHLGGQFVEYDTKDKGLWLDQIIDNAQCEADEITAQSTEA